MNNITDTIWYATEDATASATRRDGHNHPWNGTLSVIWENTDLTTSSAIWRARRYATWYALNLSLDTLGEGL